MTHTAHVIGAGVAGLAAGVKLAEAGWRVELSEAAAQPGGRCRSYADPQLGMVIDNGNHLVLSGNHAVCDYLRLIGAEDRLAGPDCADVPFVDLSNGKRWTISISDGAIPWWLLSPSRRGPGLSLRGYLAFAPLLHRHPGRTIGEVIDCRGPVWERLMRPFLLAVLNTEPETASADLAAAVIGETLAKGGRACRPRIASPTLAAAFVDPAVATLSARGGEVRLGRRLKSIGLDDGVVASLEFSDGVTPIEPGDTVVLAVNPAQATQFVPELQAPAEYRAIVNAHFRVAAPAGAEPMIGVIGGLAEWIFAFDDRISVTISGADRLIDDDRRDLAERIWREVAAVHRLPDDLPPWQLVKEKRATYAATPEQDARRPLAGTRWRNLWLAGDWTQTGLPATLEGAIRSGFTAAALAAARS